MRDYSQVLTASGGPQGANVDQIQGQQRNRNRNRKQNRQQRNDNVSGSGQQTGGGGNGQTQNFGVPKRTKFALANSLGTSAEAAKDLGISRRQAHRIVDTAYRTGESRS